MSDFKPTGKINFKVIGQPAEAPWKQKLLRKALNEDAPNELRFQCRIATDARVNFKHVELPDGESFSLSPKGGPQFGKNVDGHAFLTVTVVRESDGQSYRLRWIGDNVPARMKRVAVAHDEGKKVAAASIPLDFSRAEVTPVLQLKGYKDRTARNYAAENAARGDKRFVEGGKTGKTRPKRCSRLRAADLEAH